VLPLSLQNCPETNAAVYKDALEVALLDMQAMCLLGRPAAAADAKL
jgi:hypothetical protein